MMMRNTEDLFQVQKDDDSITTNTEASQATQSVSQSNPIIPVQLVGVTDRQTDRLTR